MEGRDGDLEALAAQLSAVGERQRLALIAGEPGIGKTRLASEFAAKAHAGGAVVLYGRSTDGSDPPYRPFAEALGHYLKHAPGETLSQDEARELARIVPGLLKGASLSASEGGGSGAEQYVLFGAVASFLGRISRDAPLVILLEDLHWADEGSVLLLRYLMTGDAEISALIVGTYRPADVAVDCPIAHALAELGREQEVSQADLAPLSREDALLLLTNLAGRGLRGSGAELAESLHRECAGNPLFLTELVRAMLDAGTIHEVDGTWSIEGGELSAAELPSNLAGLIQRRVAELGPAAAEVLSAAAVVGQEFDPHLVERALDLSADELRVAWDAAERAGLVVETQGGCLGFNHPLVGRVLYDGLGRHGRGALHRSMAQALAGFGREADVAEIARHWAGAVPPDPGSAGQWAAGAGGFALERYDGASAARWYARALDFHEQSGQGDERTRCELLIGLGAGQRLSGHPGYRDTLLTTCRLAQETGEDDLLVAAALLNNRGFASATGQIDEERVAILEGALRAVGGSDSPERSRLLATLAIELTFAGEWDRRVQMSDEALAIARRLGDRAALAHVLTLRCITIWMPETLDERLSNAAEAVRLADELGDPWAQFHAVRWRFVGLVQSGALAEATVVAQRQDELARRLGDPTTGWMSTYDRGTLATIAGRLDEAERLGQEALDSAAGSGPVDPLPIFTSQLTCIRYEQGRLPELQPLLAKVVAENPGIPAFRAFLALSYVEGELRNEARNLLAIDLKTEFGEMPADPVWLAGHAIYAHVAADLGDRTAATVLYERLAPWHSQIAYAGVGAWGDVDHALGRLATVMRQFEEAELHLAAALDRAGRIGAPIWAARVNLDIARLLLARDAPGDRDMAVEPLEEAVAGAARAGAATIERRARSLREHRRAMDVAAEAGQSGQRLRIRATTDPVAQANGRPRPVADADRSTGRLELEGDYWTIRLADSEIRLRDGKGVQYLSQLLSHPGVELHAADLQAGGADPAPASAAAAAAELSVRAAGTDDAGEMLDAEAKRCYRLRIDELRDEIEEAERFNDTERASRGREELEFLGRELAAAVGMGGRDRKAASQAERARVNVTRALRGTIKRISEHDGSLGGHLEASVHTGTFCCYEPSPSEAVRWQVSDAAA